MAGNDSYTKLLLHMDDAGLTDSSASSHIITLNDNVTRSAVQSKFGGYSGYFDGTGDYLSIPDSDDWDMGTEDFTIDFWIYPTSFTGYRAIMGAGKLAGVEGWGLYTYSDGVVRLSITGGASDIITSSNQSLTINTWNHVAVVRKGTESTDLNVYIGGTGGNAPATGNVTIDGSDTAATIGRYYADNDNYYVSGYIDELRLSKGIARWTSNFTPPTEAYYASYYLSGEIDKQARILVLNESDWAMDYNQTHSAGSYSAELLDNNKKTLIVRADDGESFGAGNLTPTE